MANNTNTSLADFQTLEETDETIAAQWPAMVRALQGLGTLALNKQNTAAPVEPADILSGFIFGDAGSQNVWRIIVSVTDLLIQENTGTEGSPTWTTRATFNPTTGLSIDDLDGYVDWSVTGAETIHDDRIAESNVTQHEAAIDHDALTNFLAAEHVDWAVTGAEQLHDDRVAASNVTQHEAALTITEAQISDLDHDATAIQGEAVNAAAPTTGQVLRHDGVEWAADDMDMVFLEEIVAAVDATVDFTSGIDATFTSYLVAWHNVVPAQDDVEFWLRYSVSGTFQATGYYSAADGLTSASATNTLGIENGTRIALLGNTNASGSISSTASESGTSGWVTIFNPADSGERTFCVANGTYAEAGNANRLVSQNAAGYRTTAEAHDGFRFMFEADNITSGIFRLYGIV